LERETLLTFVLFTLVCLGLVRINKRYNVELLMKITDAVRNDFLDSWKKLEGVWCRGFFFIYGSLREVMWMLRSEERERESFYLVWSYIYVVMELERKLN
jgi:hypothetical protein